MRVLSRDIALDDLTKAHPGCLEEGPEGKQSRSQVSSLLQQSRWEVAMEMRGTDGYGLYFEWRTDRA